jgi:hypothetical protein
MRGCADSAKYLPSRDWRRAFRKLFTDVSLHHGVYDMHVMSLCNQRDSPPCSVIAVVSMLPDPISLMSVVINTMWAMINTSINAFTSTLLRRLPTKLFGALSAAFLSNYQSLHLLLSFASHHNRTPSDLASNLISEIIRSLVDLTEFSVDYSYLQDPLLKPLHRTLFLTGYALQLYEDTPLGPNLAALISPEVEKCCLLFQNILDDIDRYRSTLHSTHIPASRLPALWSKSKVHELAWKLCHCQRQLGQFLVALNS